MMRNALTALLLAGLLLGALGAAAQGAAKRVALVIGNGQYTTVGRLANPANDAKAVAAMLKTCDFDVIMHTDLDLEGMDKAVKAFSGKMSGAECALFFFAGHGLQKDGMNYLVPVTREPETEGEIRSRCLNAEEVLAAMERSGARVNIMLLDACRNNPLPKDNRYTVRGLANMEAPAGSLIAFATGPGKTASDGKGANSPFTESLLKYLPTPGVDVELVLKRVTDEVLQKTGEQQSPWRQSNLRNEFYFVPGSGGSSAPGLVAALPPSPPAAPSLVGHLQVAVNAPAARVQVDGAQKGMASPEKPLNLEGLLAGKVKVRVDAEGYDPLEKVVDIAKNEWTQEEFILSKVIVIQRDAPTPPEVLTGAPRLGDVRSFAGHEMAYIPPGTFQMGSRISPDEVIAKYGREKDNKSIHEREQPRHQATLTQGFWMATHEVTNAQFEVFVRATGHKTDAEKEGTGRTYNISDKSDSWEDTRGAAWRNPGWTPAHDEPVVLVSWNDAQAYIRWLDTQGAGRFRLPTEAEWEYACRAGSETEFFWGDEMAGGRGYLNAADETKLPNGSQFAHPFPFSDGYWRTAPVKQFKTNPWGLYDMLGNVWEWCEDWYGDYSFAAQTDPQGPSSGSTRVVRGASWLHFPEVCRSSFRHGRSPTYRDVNLGFRVVRTS